jgi:hypothetical protein
MDKTFDLNIRPLVAVIKAFEGLPSSADVLEARPTARGVLRRAMGWPCHQGNTGRLVWWDFARRLT